MSSSLSTAQATALKRIIYAWALAFAPHAAKIFLLGQAGYKWDNTLGRRNMSKDSKEMKISDVKLRRAQRAESAHQNGNESWPLFAAAVVAAVATGVDASVLESSTRNYLLLRIAYNLFFIFGGSQGVAFLRTMSWLGSVGMSINLLLKSSALAGKTIL